MRHHGIEPTTTTTNQMTSMSLTIQARYYALLVTAIGYCVDWWPETIGVYLAWHILGSSSSPPSAAMDIHQLHDELRAEYQRIMSDNDMDDVS